MTTTFADNLRKITGDVKEKQLQEYVRADFPKIKHICVMTAETGEYKCFYIQNTKHSLFDEFFADNGLISKYTYEPCRCSASNEQACSCDDKGYEIRWDSSSEVHKNLCNELRMITEDAIKDRDNKYIQEQINFIKEICTDAANKGKSSVIYESRNKLNAYDIFFRNNGIKYEYQNLNYKLSW